MCGLDDVIAQIESIGRIARAHKLQGGLRHSTIVVCLAALMVKQFVVTRTGMIFAHLRAPS